MADLVAEYQQYEVELEDDVDHDDVHSDDEFFA